MGLSEEKYKKLLEILSSHKRIGVAFSGGIDSTFLLYSAVNALGSDNVLAYSCVSEVNSEHSLANMRNVFQNHFAGELELNEVDIHPLTWKEFTINNDKRCYFCKKRMYSCLLEELRTENCFVLADGTNVDDLKKSRPGLRAIRELNIQTPLVEVGLTKLEIRGLAYSKGLINHDLSSNSCLATRVSQGVEITKKRLDVIESAEDYLRKLGFEGCRVKVKGDVALVELHRKDFASFVKDDVRSAVLNRFRSLGLHEISLNLTTR